MTGEQLTLFDLDTLTQVHCPRCGHTFRPATTEELQQRRRWIMQHPRIQALPASSRAFLGMTPIAFLGGTQMGVMELHRYTGYSPTGVQRQVQNLVKYGLVIPVTKRTGGQYCQYRLELTASE